MTVNRTFPSVPKDIREWSRYLSKLFFADSFTITFQGTTADLTGTAYYTAAAGIVTIMIPQMQGTSDDTVAYILGIPTEITPRREQYCPLRVVDNGAAAWGVVIVNTDTPWQVFTSADEGAFTSSGTKGTKATTITYMLD